MRRINFGLFSIVSVILIFATFYSFSEVCDVDELKLAGNNYLHFLSEFFNVMRFPTHVLLPALTKLPFYFAFGLAINCFLYSLVFERIVYLIFHKRNDDEENAQQDTPVEI